MSETSQRDELAALIHAQGYPDPVKLPLGPDKCETCTDSYRIADVLLAAGWSKADEAEVEWGVRAVWDDGELAEGPLSEPPNTEEAAREVCAALIDEWAPQVRSAEVVSRIVGPWQEADHE